MEQRPSSFSLFCLSLSLSISFTHSLPPSPLLFLFDVVCLLGGCSTNQEKNKKKKGGKNYERTGLTLSYSEGEEDRRTNRRKKEKDHRALTLPDFLLPLVTIYVSTFVFMYFLCLFASAHSQIGIQQQQREKKV